MKWFRLYASLVHNPKVQLLPGDVFKTWINILCIAGEFGGVLPCTDEIAFRIRLPKKRTERDIEVLLNRGLLDRCEDRLVPHDWDEWQYESDSTNNRVKAYRERLRANGGSTDGYLKHKAAVFSRDGERCVYCGSAEKLCLDHMIPVLLGGDDDPGNLATACKRCNSGKAGRTPEQAGYGFQSVTAELLYQEAKARLLSPSLSRQQSPPVTVTVTPPEQNRTEERRAAPPRNGTHPPLRPGQELFDWSVSLFVGPVEDNAWQKFGAHVCTPELVHAWQANLPLWMRTKRYRDGFHSFNRFVSSGVWHSPPKPQLVEGEEEPPPQPELSEEEKAAKIRHYEEIMRKGRPQ